MLVRPARPPRSCLRWSAWLFLLGHLRLQAPPPCLTLLFPAAGREDALLAEGYQGDSDDGIVTRSLDYLFRAAVRRAGSDGCRYTLRVSCAEIYNEQIHDLIPLDKKPLQARAGRGWGGVGERQRALS